VIHYRIYFNVSEFFEYHLSILFPKGKGII